MFGGAAPSSAVGLFTSNTAASVDLSRPLPRAVQRFRHNPTSIGLAGGDFVSASGSPMSHRQEISRNASSELIATQVTPLPPSKNASVSSSTNSALRFRIQKANVQHGHGNAALAGI